MYTIKYYEEGRFITDIGSPTKTLTEAICQIRRIVARTDCEELKSIVGVRWEKAGKIACFLVVSDCFGQFIPIIEEN